MWSATVVFVASFFIFHALSATDNLRNEGLIAAIQGSIAGVLLAGLVLNAWLEKE